MARARQPLRRPPICRLAGPAGDGGDGDRAIYRLYTRKPVDLASRDLHDDRLWVQLVDAVERRDNAAASRAFDAIASWWLEEYDATDTPAYDPARFSDVRARPRTAALAIARQRDGMRVEPSGGERRRFYYVALMRSEKVRRMSNVFACLVHERQESVVDLVRNLALPRPGLADPALQRRARSRRCCDGGSPSTGPSRSSIPSPTPLQWGALHEFAIDCMRFALEEAPFDTLTIVDSDQLLLRQGYSDDARGVPRGRPRASGCSATRPGGSRRTRASRRR